GDTLTIGGADAIAGAGALTKSGAGLLDLTGDNTYTGATTVSAGTLRVNGSLAAASDVAVASGATLGGAGTIGGDVIASVGGRVAPGNSIGTLTIGGDYTWNGSTNGAATHLFELSNSNSTSDRLVIGGAFAEGSGTTFRFDFQGT